MKNFSCERAFWNRALKSVPLVFNAVWPKLKAKQRNQGKRKRGYKRSIFKGLCLFDNDKPRPFLIPAEKEKQSKKRSPFAWKLLPPYQLQKISLQDQRPSLFYTNTEILTFLGGSFHPAIVCPIWWTPYSPWENEKSEATFAKVFSASSINSSSSKSDFFQIRYFSKAKRRKSLSSSLQ